MNKESFKRITSGGEYMPEIDGLRFVAIVSVVLYHVFVQSQLFAIWHRVPGVLEHFRRGVELFFVIRDSSSVFRSHDSICSRRDLFA